ncbi:MAG: type II 3-dehydroquinate dehydratase [Chitinophagales bacterium]|jgi:3-dehydroquinate dehydratase II|nr:type II 3-dehydroquinate dehydratase [Sphingobacteriales bacterium]MBP7534142.1 type II 3-dehydroquinate dehydratase [Chitinophagales bacterium]
MKNILVLNGPNLNLLGKREPHIYGSQTFEDYFEQIKFSYPNVVLHYFQSNHEGQLIDKLHEIGFLYDGIVFNPGGYTHTSVALADAVAAIKAPVIEVHISNTFAREAFRHHSYISGVARGTIVGLGLAGYQLAISFLVNE